MKKSVITLFLAVVSGDPPMSPCAKVSTQDKQVKTLSPTLGIAGESPTTITAKTPFEHTIEKRKTEYSEVSSL